MAINIFSDFTFEEMQSNYGRAKLKKNQIKKPSLKASIS